MTSFSVLWLDNDPGNIESLVTSLRARGHEVVMCRTVSQAEVALNRRDYDLLILDVMIPVTDEELSMYSYEATDETLATGLVFYQRMSERLAAANTEVLVMTVRIDRAIAVAFREAGLPPEHFATRYELRNTQHFLARVNDILERKQSGVGESSNGVN